MNKIAFIYPGQGAQKAGMGKDFYAYSPLAAEMYDKASEILNIDMKALCFEENDLLDQTEYTQAAMVTTCLAMTAVLEEAGLGAFIRSQSKGLDSDVGNAGSSLSGGQRQKMGIARALLSRAEYMIFDEATSSVDPQSEKEIWKTIGHLAESRTLIIISHRMSSVQNADCIYVLRDGRVAQHGTHEVLMAEAGLYKELVVRQQAMEVAE